MNYKIILEGIVGSHAYGLNNKDSDIDIKGIFLYNTNVILGITSFLSTINQDNPDIEYHEVEKFIQLAMSANPTILELLYLSNYNILTEEGKLLIEHRNSFLSKKIYKSYGGYALDQARKLYRKGMGFSRYEKHARHCFRLLLQGEQLLREHTLDVKVSNPSELLQLSKLNPVDLLSKFEEEFKKFDTIPTTLPDEPNYTDVNNILLQIRKRNYE
jgi:hypothetical protein